MFTPKLIKGLFLHYSPIPKFYFTVLDLCDNNTYQLQNGMSISGKKQINFGFNRCLLATVDPATETYRNKLRHLSQGLFKTSTQMFALSIYYTEK